MFDGIGECCYFVGSRIALGKSFSGTLIVRQTQTGKISPQSSQRSQSWLRTGSDGFIGAVWKTAGRPQSKAACNASIVAAY